ncbi:MAG TPA: MmcQ/YjbR family DNA-binding protein [Chitinophagaceae bacterium]|nr:MmcQ/YjbR family DNA-binding protein [Chitinophagaceae bacterium]
MDIEYLREYCLSKKNVEESLPFGPDNLVYKVNGRIFLIASLDESPLRFNVKCDPDKALELREEFSCVLPGYHMNKKHWNTIIADGSVSSTRLREWIDDSYELIASAVKKKGRK